MERNLIRDINIHPNMSLGEFIELLSTSHGFTPASIIEAAEILVNAYRRGVIKFLSFTGNIVATGIRGLIAQMVREGFVDVIITTCGAIDHDIARSFGGAYLKGYFEVNDYELYKHGYHRLGNIFIKIDDYGPLIERKTREILDKILEETGKTEWGVRELLHAFGKYINDRNSILRVAYERNVPIYVPGIVDGAFGTQLFMYSQFKRFKLDLFRDEKELADIVFSAKETSALIVGGGISKHHTIWWNQFKGGLDYVVYITTAIEYDGSLSGARPHEAISWGKIKPNARKTVVYGDATLILPLLYAAIKKLLYKG